jgi:endonuclease/exonuclease/phosphatase family metal-dependent hydrolase
MRHILAVLALALCSACATAHNYLDPGGPRYSGDAGAVPPSSADATLRAVSFNVEYGRRTAEAIRALGVPPLASADVLLLQEMDVPGVTAMAQALGMNYVYYPASRHPSTGRDFGNAILSPWPIVESHKVLLPGKSFGIRQARAAVAATVHVRGRPVVVYSVHLTSPWGMGGGGRARQADAVLEDAAAVTHPVIVAGDFNSSGIGERFRARGFEWPTRNTGHTVGPFTFDHIFTRGLHLAGSGSAGVAKKGPRASDHWPIWALFVLEPVRE